MNRFTRSCSKLRRFIAERLGVTSITMPATFLVIVGLTVLVMLSNSACGSSASKTPPERTRPIPTPTDISTPTATLTPTPTPLPPVILEDPEDGSCLGCESPVALRWSCPYILQEGECYQLRVKGQSLSYDSLFHPAEDRFTLPALSPGKYNWAVTVVRSTDPDEYVEVSKESEWRSFEILPPTSVVYSISPTMTVQGTGVPVVISGENFTHSLALTIGVPLKASFVNSSMITATIPVTLEVGKYSVLVEGSTCDGVSFTVSEPSAPTPIPVLTRPVYPPPVLGGVDIFGSDVTFHWSWDGKLADNDYFDLRVGIGTPGEGKTWTKETQQSWTFTGQGEYVWEIAICRGIPGAADCSGNKQLAVSERGTFWFAPPSKPKPTPKPP